MPDTLPRPDPPAMSHINPGLILGAKRPVALVSGFLFVTAAACISANLLWQRLPRSRKPPYEKSPAKTIPPAHEDLPYPPDALPGARDVETPYGSIRVYEWGPASGERVLFVHGISTPVVALGDLGHEMVARGYRVMLFGTLRCATLTAANITYTSLSRRLLRTNTPNKKN